MDLVLLCVFFILKSSFIYGRNRRVSNKLSKSYLSKSNEKNKVKDDEVRTHINTDLLIHNPQAELAFFDARSSTKSRWKSKSTKRKKNDVNNKRIQSKLTNTQDNNESDGDSSGVYESTTDIFSDFNNLCRVCRMASDLNKDITRDDLTRDINKDDTNKDINKDDINKISDKKELQSSITEGSVSPSEDADESSEADLRLVREEDVKLRKTRTYIYAATFMLGVAGTVLYYIMKEIKQ